MNAPRALAAETQWMVERRIRSNGGMGIARDIPITGSMTIVSTDVLALAEKRLAWIDQRQRILAQNIANANTPGYAAKDIAPFSEVLASQSGRGATGATVSKDRASPGRSIDGNAVALDEQLEKVAESDTAQQLASNLYKKYLGLFKTAIGRS